jgi:hypothetical protein
VSFSPPPNFIHPTFPNPSLCLSLSLFAGVLRTEVAAVVMQGPGPSRAVFMDATVTVPDLYTHSAFV